LPTTTMATTSGSPRPTSPSSTGSPVRESKTVKYAASSTGGPPTFGRALPTRTLPPCGWVEARHT
jgi:hypothetical protein